jgi:outer membrane murein-binding lipoprotein Lpp
MTPANEKSRLDRLEDIAAILVTHAEATDRRIDQLVESHLLLRQDVQLQGANIDRLTANVQLQGANIDRLTANVDRLGIRVDQLTEDVGNLAIQLEEQAQQSEQDRSQAAIDRADFRSTVDRLLEVLTQQHNGNGHG